MNSIIKATLSSPNLSISYQNSQIPTRENKHFPVETKFSFQLIVFYSFLTMSPAKQHKQLKIPRKNKLNYTNSDQNYLAVGMKTRVNDPIHVQVKIIKLHAVRVRSGDINLSPTLRRLFFDHVHNGQMVPICEPPVKRWNPHP